MVSDPAAPLVLLRPAGDADDWRPVIQGPARRPVPCPGSAGPRPQPGTAGEGFDEAHRWLCDELAARDIAHYRLVGYSLGGGSRFITPAIPRRVAGPAAGELPPRAACR